MEDTLGTGPSISEMKRSIQASGYAMEARLSKFLTDFDYYVEPNLAFQDPLTHVSREVDLRASLLGVEFVAHEPEVYVDHDLVIEAINNTTPVVFFSGASYPLDTGVHKLRTRPTPTSTDDGSHFLNQLEVQEAFRQLNVTPCTQYCSFTRKRAANKSVQDVWMAHHPDDLFETFKKLLYFSDSMVSPDQAGDQSQRSHYYSLKLVQPVLIIHHELYIAQALARSLTLKKVNHVVFEFRHHYLRDPSFLLIDIITERYLPAYLKLLRNESNELGSRIYAEVLKAQS